MRSKIDSNKHNVHSVKTGSESCKVPTAHFGLDYLNVPLAPLRR